MGSTRIHDRLQARHVAALSAVPVNCRYYYFGGVSGRRVRAQGRRELLALAGDRESSIRVVEWPDGSCAAAALRFQPWDSERLGFRAGRIDFYASDPLASNSRDGLESLLDEVRDLARAMALQLVSLKLDVGLSTLARQLVNHGFSLMNCEHVLVHDGPEIGPAVAPPSGVEVRAIARTRMPALERLGGLFGDSRFHADPRIPAAAADRLWRRSIRDACEGFADQVFVAFHDGEPAGFVTCRDDQTAAETFGSPVRDFALVGVKRKCQGRGIGTWLMHHASMASLRRTPRLQVTTQAHNYAAIRLYQRIGFKLAASRYNMHLWI